MELLEAEDGGAEQVGRQRQPSCTRPCFAPRGVVAAGGLRTKQYRVDLFVVQGSSPVAGGGGGGGEQAGIIREALAALRALGQGLDA